MKRIDLERYLREQGCVPYREGVGHSIWFNPAQRKIASIPRHREIKEREQFAQSVNSAKFLSPEATVHLLVVVVISVIQRLFETVTHPLEHHFETLLLHGLIVGSLEPIARRFISQRVSGSWIVYVA